MDTSYSLEDYLGEDRIISKKMKKKLDALIAEEGHEGVKSIIQYYGSHK
ncbi:MAG: hypothetical protein KZQ74_10010 [gamma proteobacterium symbiont of Bathyaustriella thionipta]|nr:hypothetical protein [gamma proteobacterium symbiont of Bathyaustriella thionipta]MCU7951752.1 hypothetical protein [gamma proteobacterium symbiont of Bathyaustriella thionipta]MCU7958351.1 hypothetical protein [gamma proteobacterium symbiont of Bathyaustriella thionipta]MCU7967508.1 hypothetical protein [gamma proteobacterium symbiont of Bathyaustriella thionipta]